MMNKTLKLLDGLIYWLIVSLPFFLGVASAPLNICIGLLLVAYLLKKTLTREPIIPKTAVTNALLCFFLATCLSLVNSGYYKDSLRGGILRLLQYIFVFSAVAQEIKDERHMRRIFLSMLFGMLLISFDGFWQIVAKKDFIRGYPPVFNIGLIRATASFKDSNLMGIYLSAMAPLVFGLALFYFTGIKRKAFLFASLILLAGITVTYSRPTLLAIYLALLFLGIAKKQKALVIFLVLLLLIAPFVVPASVKEWARSVDYNPLRFMCNDDRIAVYRNSLNMIRDHPIIGVGVNTFMKNYKKYKEAREYRGIVTLDYMYAHNNFLHMASEIGLVGLSAFFWFLYALFFQCRRIYISLDDNYLRVFSLSLTACLIAFLVNGLTESSLYYARVAVIFWYLAGCALALNRFRHANQIPEH